MTEFMQCLFRVISRRSARARRTTAYRREPDIAGRASPYGIVLTRSAYKTQMRVSPVAPLSVSIFGLAEYAATVAAYHGGITR